MKFLKQMIGRKPVSEPAETGPEMSIAALQADLDQSDLHKSLRDPSTAWAEKAAQRPVEDEGPDLVKVPGHRDALEPGDETPPRRALSRDLDWDDDAPEDAAEAADDAGTSAFDAPRARRQTRPVAEDDHAGSDDGFDEFDEDDAFEDEFDTLEPEEEQAIRDNAILVEEIRDAIAAVRHIETEPPVELGAAGATDRKDWENDEVFGRKALARDRLARLSDNGDDDRILEETNTKLHDDDAANRRRQAMAHLKAAAAATKADRVLKRVVGRDPAMDPDHQVQYREDLANVVRQRGPRSEPISRPLSRPRTRPLPAQETAVAETAEIDRRRDALAAAAKADPHRDEPNETISKDATPAEATMDVEKIDLKTALERQKAILRAEREALEAEIAKETADAGAESADASETPLRSTASVDPEETAERPDDAGQEHEDLDDVRAALAEDEAASDAEDDAADLADTETVAADVAADPVPDDADDWDRAAPADIPAPQPAAVKPPKLRVRPEADIEDDEDAAESVDVTAYEGQDEVSEDDMLELDADEGADIDVEPAPAAPRKAGRVKTRLLGFQSKSDNRDVFSGKAARGAGPVRFPVGWIVVTDGAGFGHSFSLLSGVSKIGRGDDQAVQLDFGDTAISRDNHAAIAFDEELNQFFLGHGGKSNVVRLNGKPVLSTEELYDGDEIRIGETTLKFIALCSEEFTWSDNEGDGADHVRSA